MQYRTDPANLQATADWPATREAALERLERFLPHAGSDYASRRNYDMGPEARDNVSVLSPYIRHRLITEQEVAAAAVAAHGLKGAEVFLKEVCWRTYWKGWLETRPLVWDRTLADIAVLTGALSGDVDLRKRYEAACGGATGIACFDSWASELVTTGYLHNHARMWFASIWIFSLELPWQLGADFFMKHLLDGDPASNTLSWRWMCGLHTKGKTYLARAKNIDEFTGGRFRGIAGLAEAAEPLTEPADAFPEQRVAPRGRPPHGDVALVIAEDDLSAETLDIGSATVKRIIVIDVPHAYSVASGRVRRFKTVAIADGAERASRHFWREAHLFDSSKPDAAATLGKVSGGLPLVMAEMPVGPSRSELKPLLDRYAVATAPVHTLRCDWDESFWPHARGGYFQLGAEIPSVLEELGIATAD